MRIICFLFFTIFILEVRKSAADKDKYEAIIDAKLVEYDDDSEIEKPIRKERKMLIKNFVGTNLFGESGCRKTCFSTEDIALLASRRDFESLIPKDFPDCLLDDELAKILMQYFYTANQVINKMASGHSKLFAEKALYDTLGGYLHYYMIPISRYSFYAGLLKLRTVQNVMELYNECKYAINTNGNNWRSPITDFSDLDLQIDPLKIVINKDEEDTSCIQLDMLDERFGEDDDMIVALPRLDSQERGVLGNLWLPFKRKRSFNLQSCMSAFVLLRYFELTTRCYNYQGICQDKFNKMFKEWILENVEVHLADDVLYPGLGAVLRIIETLRRNNKGAVVLVSKTNPKRQKLLDKTHTENRRSGIFDDNNNPIEDVTDIDSVQKEKEGRLRTLYIALGVTIVIFIIVFIAIAVTLFKSWRNKKNEGDQEKPPESEKRSLFGRKSRKGDEEQLLKSKKSSKSKKKDSKNVEKPDSPSETQCFGLCKKSSPAVIETSSMDSDTESNKKKKSKAKDKAAPPPAKSKSVTVNSQKRTSTSKNSKTPDAEEKPTKSRGGILKRPSR